MARFMVQRALLAVPLLLGTTTITFLLMMSTMGSYVPGLELNASLRPDDVQRLRTSMGLDRPLVVLYGAWLWNAVRGDFGFSLIDGASVSSLILERLPYTLYLSGTAWLLGVLIAVPLGTISALRRGSWVDHALTGISVAGFALPQFWLGIVAIFIFAVMFKAWGLPALPATGATNIVGDSGFMDRVAHLILPATVLSFAYMSTWSRYIRTAMLEALNQDYVRTARGKGLPERSVVLIHALRNALLPLVTLVGLEFRGLVSGSLVIEVIFAWPGVGRLAYGRATAYDYTTVLGIVTVVTLIVILGNLIADLLYGALDPRVRQQ